MIFKTLLVEIGVEELPIRVLKPFQEAFSKSITQQLSHSKLSFGQTHTFATPRRFAVIVEDVPNAQEDYEHLRKGPSVKAAYDSEGNLSNAALGFAQSCGVDPSQLQKQTMGKGEFLCYCEKVRGQSTASLLPEIVTNAIKSISIPKPMRWGSHEFSFSRPIHWITLMFDDSVIEANILGIKTQGSTFGHRFHHPQAIHLKLASDYEVLLEKKGYVIADFEKRRNKIKQAIINLAEKHQAKAVLDEQLLDDVTGIVEWPVALKADFSPEFLQVPSESLISAMQDHQRSFALKNEQGELLPAFITISNIESKQPEKVIHGNEKVMHARLADAAFFYKTDIKKSLQHRLPSLKHVLFQKGLGSLFDKSERIANLSKHLAKPISRVDAEQAYQAGLLCKADLVSDMVQEFPELQGIMGEYYALNDHHEPTVAKAIRDHYAPRFSGDELPREALGDMVALADKLDTLVGIFGINQQPTGDKDPFALRRAALGCVRILVEHQYPINILNVIDFAIQNYQEALPNKELQHQVYQFILERLRAWYLEQEIARDTVQAVFDAKNENAILFDIHNRIMAVHDFRKRAEAVALAAANKRASNILAKSEIDLSEVGRDFSNINQTLFDNDAEKDLYSALQSFYGSEKLSVDNQNYPELLNELASLRTVVDRFFDDVMVMTDDKVVRNNRLAMLASLRALFIRIADLSKIQE